MQTISCLPIIIEKSQIDDEEQCNNAEVCNSHSSGGRRYAKKRMHIGEAEAVKDEQGGEVSDGVEDGVGGRSNYDEVTAVTSLLRRPIVIASSLLQSDQAPRRRRHRQL